MDISSYGSPSALSIVAGVMNANPIIAAILAGSFATVIAGTFVYREYQISHQKKRMKEIEAINQLYRKHLCNINIPELDEKIHLPAIFTVDEAKSTVSSMHFTFEQIEEMNNIAPEITDPDLLPYGEHISDTILKLKEFYLKRHTDTDVTAGVLSWLLYILTTYCRNFQGFAIDIAFLKQIEKFISEYASMDGTEVSETFSWLIPVDNHLLKSIGALEKHRNTRSLRNRIAELGYICRVKTGQMLKILAQLTVKDKYISYAGFVSPIELEQGILHQAKINRTLFGVPIITVPEKRVKSFFENWLRILSSGYLSAIGIPSSEDMPEIQPPETIFLIPEEKNDIKYAFNRTTNFLTRLSKGKKLEHIDDPYDLHDRLEVYQTIAVLTHQLSSLLWLCMQILRCFRQMGSIYIENPHHMQRIFYVLENLCKKIGETSGVLHNQTGYFFGKMAKESRIRSHRVIPDNLLEYTSLLQKKIEQMSTEITNIHKGNAAMHNAAKRAGRNMTIKHIMNETASRLEKAYHIPALEWPAEPAANDAEYKWDEREEKEDREEDEKWDPNNIPPREFHDLMQEIALLMSGIQGKILQLQAAGDPSAGSLLRLYSTLIDMQKKSIMLSEQGETQSAQRTRSRKIIQLTLSFCQRTNRLLSPDSNRIIAYTDAPAPSAWSEANSFEYAIHIDAHQNFFSRILYAVFKCGFFQTDTRKKVAAVCKAFDELEDRTPIRDRA